MVGEELATAVASLGRRASERTHEGRSTTFKPCIVAVHRCIGVTSANIGPAAPDIHHERIRRHRNRRNLRLRHDRPDDDGDQTHPSYISPKAFARSLIMALADKTATAGSIVLDQTAILTSVTQSISALPSSSLRDFGRGALLDAQGSLERFETSLADRYDETMMRLSGEFKRRQQLVTFLAGFVLAVTLNIDVIAYAKRLQTDEDLREKAVATATAYSELCQAAANCAGRVSETDAVGDQPQAPGDDDIAAGVKALAKDLQRLNGQLSVAALGWNSCLRRRPRRTVLVRHSV